MDRDEDGVPRARVLVIDTGQNLVGVYDVDADAYRPYRGDDIPEALERIRRAGVVVTFCGTNWNDMEVLAKFAGAELFELKGRHDDMSRVCWPGILGSSLIRTYERHLRRPLPSYGDSGDRQQDDNRRDVAMTFELWEAWMAGKLDPSVNAFLPPPQPLQAGTERQEDGR